MNNIDQYRTLKRTQAEAEINKWKKGATCFHLLSMLAAVKLVGNETIKEMAEKENIRFPNGLSTADSPLVHARAATLFCLGRMLENMYRLNATLGRPEIGEILKGYGVTEESVYEFMSTNMQRALKAMKVVIPKRENAPVKAPAIKTTTPSILHRAICVDGSSCSATSQKAQLAKKNGQIKRYDELYVMTRIEVPESQLQNAIDACEKERYEDIAIDYAHGKAILTVSFPVSKVKDIDSMPEHITEPANQLKWITEKTHQMKGRLRANLGFISGTLNSFSLQYR